MQKKRSGYLYEHYHWVVAVVLLLMVLIHGGSLNNFSTLHLIPITEKLQITRADFAMAYSVKSIVGMISTFFSGFIIAKWGSRITAPLGLILLGSSYVLIANSNSYAMLVLGCALMGASYGFCTTAGAVAVIRLWFHRYEGTILGLVSAATGLGSSILSIAQTAAMEQGGFRASLQLCAVFIFGIALLVFLLLRNKPEDMGLLPLGDGERMKKRPTSKGYAGLPMEQLWKQPVFYLLIFGIVLYSFALYLSFNVVRNYFVDCNFSVAEATGLYSAMMLLLSLTKFLAGACCDKWGAKIVNSVCILSGAVGLVLLAVMESFAVAVIAVVIYTVSLPLLTIMGPLVAKELIGYHGQAQYTGILVASVSLANLFGNYLTNWIYDRYASYRPSFWLAAILLVVASLL
ncbi:MAG: MFS transporter, partial [Oscillospiraceae bacterium]|nr:MFS transporter [Oscillospiraceae bacterium]